jgi:hypothetical protein
MDFVEFEVTTADAVLVLMPYWKFRLVFGA